MHYLHQHKKKQKFQKGRKTFQIEGGSRKIKYILLEHFEEKIETRELASRKLTTEVLSQNIIARKK